MRLLTLFLPTLALSTLFPPSVSSIHPHALAHRRDHARSPASSIIASRQYRVPRDLLDVCINVNANLLADASQLLGLSSLLGALGLGADIELCLCLKDLELYLDTNDQLSALIGLLGKDAVGALITALINTSPDAKQCTFPSHAHHTCNTSDPCHYACDPPYVSDGDQCVCALPNVSCNGVCGDFPQGCSSAIPRSLAKTSKVITTFAEAQASCKTGETVCGIAGRESAPYFECIDTSSTKDSCGGCMTPHPFFEVDTVRSSSGKDCSAIANTKSTVCSSSRCVVNSCQEGWVPNAQKDACIPNATMSKMRRVKKRSEAETPATVVATGSSLDIGSQIGAVVKAVLDLNIHGPAVTGLTSAPTSYSVDNLAHLDTIYGLLDGVNTATSELVGSTSIHALVTYGNNLLDVSSLLQSTVNDCHCVTDLGLQSFSSDVNNVVSGVRSLLTLCHDHPNGGFSPSPSIGSSGSAASSPKTSGQPIIAGLSTVLSDLGIQGNSGAVVNGLVSPDTAKSLNNVLDGLSLGPNNYKRQDVPPISALVNATIGGNSGLLNKLTIIVNLVINLTGSAPAASSTTASPSTTSSVTSIGSTPSLSNCLIDPVIFATLYRYSIDLVESPDIESLCRNMGTLYAAECSLRDLFNECPYVDTLGLQGVEADLLLILEETQYLDNWCVANIAGGGGGAGQSSAAHASATVTTAAPTSSVAGTTVSISVSVGVSSNARSDSTTSHTASSVISGTSTSTSSSVSTSTSTHPSTTPVTSYATYVHSSSSSASSTGASITTDIPIVVSLDDVLSDLGLNGTKAVVTVDGLLGNDADESVNQILDGLSLGPHNVKRTLTKTPRQIVANVNAIVNLGGLGGAIDGLVDLVLRMNKLGSVLPLVSGLVPAVPASNPPAPVPTVPIALPPLSYIPIPALSGPASSSLVDQALVTDVVAALLGLLSLQSPTYAQFLQALDELVAASSGAAQSLSGCSCVKDLEGYEDLYRYLVDIAEAAEALEDLCKERANGVGASSTGIGASHTATATTGTGASQPSATAPASTDEPIVIGLTKLLKGLGLNIPAKVVVDGLLSNSLNHGVNSILNGLGIGPNGATRRRGAEQDW